MANQSVQTGGADHGFVVGARSPEELERYAALFIAAWDLPPEAPTGGDTFRTGEIDVSLLEAVEPAPAKAPQKPAHLAPKPAAADRLVEAAPAVEARKPPKGMNLDLEADEVVPRKRGPLIIAAVGAVAVVAGIGIWLGTRSPATPPKAEDKKEMSQSKKADLPDPGSIPAAATTTEPAKPTQPAEPTKAAEPEPVPSAKAEPEPTKSAAKVVPPTKPPAAKTATPPPPPKVVPPPPKYTPPPPKYTPPPPKFTPPPKATATGKKIKDDF